MPMIIIQESQREDDEIDHTEELLKAAHAKTIIIITITVYV